jgi:alpha-mannosidase
VQRYPHEQLEQAWKLLLFNQFHDTLAGTSIAPAYDDARDQIGHASSLAANAFNAAVQSISRQIDVEHEEDVRPVVVFNPHPWPVSTVAEIEYTWMRETGASICDEEGADVPMQDTRALTTMSGTRARLAFPVELPALGYRTYRVRPWAVELPPIAPLESDHLRLEIDPVTGRIASLLLKRTGVDLAAPAAKHAVVIDDRSDTWGHGVVAYDDEVGEFECMAVRLIESGPVRSIVRVDSRYRSSTLREDYVVAAGARHVDVRVALDWHEPLKLLKLRYPTSIAATEATYETPYGHLVRPANGDEEPGQSWVDVSGAGRGLAVINDAKYGYDVRGGDIGISAVRSPVWAWHGPRELEEGGDFEYMDLGRQSFNVRLLPHAGDWRAAGVVRHALELNQPPYALIETYHDGPLPQRDSFAADGTGNVVVTVVKRAQDSDAWVVRAVETAGRETDARIEILGTTIEARFRPHEIKTFVGETETDLLEW